MKTYFSYSQPKHMLWILKRTFLLAPKNLCFNFWIRKYLHFTLKLFLFRPYEPDFISFLLLFYALHLRQQIFSHAWWISCLPGLVGFVALRPKITPMVMAGWSVHLTTIFLWASLNKQLTSTLCTYFQL